MFSRPVNAYVNKHVNQFSGGGQDGEYVHSPFNVSGLSDWFDHSDTTTMTLLVNEIQDITSKGPSGTVFSQPDGTRLLVTTPNVQNSLNASAHNWTKCMINPTKDAALDFEPGVDEFTLVVIGQDPLSPTWGAGCYIGKCGNTLETKQYQLSLTGVESMDAVIGGVIDAPAITRTAIHMYGISVTKTTGYFYFNGDFIHSFAIGTGKLDVSPTLCARRNDADDDYGFLQQLGYTFENIYYNKAISAGEHAYLYDGYATSKWGL